MPLTPEQIEERLKALEERNAKLEELLRSGRAFTDNPLALATDLDDWGSVKTRLEFEEIATPAESPKAETGYLYAKATGADAWPYWLNESGQESGTILWHPESTDAVSIIRGSFSDTIPNGSRDVFGTHTHNAGWTSAGIVIGTVQTASAGPAGERQFCVGIFSVAANSFGYTITAHGAVTGDTVLTVGFYADGII